MKMKHVIGMIALAIMGFGCKPSECETAHPAADEVRSALAANKPTEAAAAAAKLLPLKASDVVEVSWLGSMAENLRRVAPDYTSSDTPMERREFVRQQWASAESSYIDAYRDFKSICQ